MTDNQYVYLDSKRLNDDRLCLLKDDDAYSFVADDSDDDHQNMQRQLSAARTEAQDQAVLLERAAVNGALLAQKYFQLEGDFDELQDKHHEAMALLTTYEGLLNELRNEKQETLRRCLVFETQIDRLSMGMRDADRRYAATQGMCTELQATVARVSSEREEALNALREAHDDATALQSVQHRLKTSLEALQQERRELQSYVTEKDTAIAHLTQQNKAARLTQSIQSQKIQRLEQTVADLEAQTSDMTDHLAATYDHIDALEAQARTMAQQIADMKAAKATPSAHFEPVPVPPATSLPPPLAMAVLVLWLSSRRASVRKSPTWLGVLSATVSKPQWYMPIVHQAWTQRAF
ncbi:hypothetical protein ACHHYP_14553 [Achlya hypogyna]|uniref:Uncharacterized protein n=1 Tax=Achlya hypogyna TaxID=1202772 RepID=A0A1V9YCV3_ACHHY|nr:hypothetical protein ACHHYP_14553 [Achlya hypogyna]